MAAPTRKPEEPTSPSATDRLATVQAELARANARIAELDQPRNAALLADNNADAIALGIEITNLKLEVRAHEDKLNLLRSLAEKEAAERRAQERQAQVEAIEEKLSARDAAMQQVAAAIKQLAAAAERAININREIIAAWTWHAHDLAPALLTPQAITTAISHEEHRVSYHARRYGGLDVDDPLAGHRLPGARSPTLQLLENPQGVKPLLDVVRNASEFASRFLRTGKGSADNKDVQPQVVTEAAPVQVTNGSGEAVPRSPSQRRLSELLLQMSKLSEDTSVQGEQAYLDVVRQVAQLQTEVTAEQQIIGAKHA
jgi:hypothetical protein